MFFIVFGKTDSLFRNKILDTIKENARHNRFHGEKNLSPCTKKSNDIRLDHNSNDLEYWD